METIKVIIADDHSMVREGLRSILAGKENIIVIGEASDGFEVINMAKELSPDIILMDISMPVMNGIEATKILHKELSKVKVIILSMHNNKEYVLQSIKAGAKGYVLKNNSSSELVQSIEIVSNGEAFFSKEVSQMVLNEFVTKSNKNPLKSKGELSSRETEILVLVAKGRNTREIADILSLSQRTVETHREHIMKKLDLHTIADITRYAIKQNLI
jgi:two-component system, NarL family, nitrate/nitrite response regulator NarL